MAKAIIEIEAENLTELYDYFDNSKNIIDYSIEYEDDEDKYVSQIIINNEVHDEDEFYTYEEAKEWCDSVTTEIEEDDNGKSLTYIAYILVSNEVHDSSEFDTYEEAKKWCESVTTIINKDLL